MFLHTAQEKYSLKTIKSQISIASTFLYLAAPVPLTPVHHFTSHARHDYG